jgi:sRNA-binding carbon storage regulator CsrA
MLGESVCIGKHTKITILNINVGRVELGVSGSEDIIINLHESVSIGDSIKISVEKLNKNQVKLGIKAPESMKVDREGAVGLIPRI